MRWHLLRATLQMEEDEPTGFVKYEKFEPVVVKAIEDNEIPTDSEEDVIRAFRALDTDNKVRVSEKDWLQGCWNALQKGETQGCRNTSLRESIFGLPVPCLSEAPAGVPHHRGAARSAHQERGAFLCG